MTTSSAPITITAPATTINSSAVYAVGGAGGGSIPTPATTVANYSFSNTAYTTGSWQPGYQGSGLIVQSDAEIKGNLKVAGKDIMKLLDQIEQRLAILHPNLELEERWEELKELSKRYRELEAEIIEKEKVWSILKR